MKLGVTALALFTGMLFHSCASSISSSNNTSQPSAKDVVIGKQTWMAKNLDVSTYRNGDPIPQVQDSISWVNLTTGAWCYYENNTAYGPVYGKLYNWYAVNDPRGLAPAGYHIPSDAEWTRLTTFLGRDKVVGDKMKATTGWNLYPGIINTNSSGFTGLPGGYRMYNGTFYHFGYYGFWWSSSENVTAYAWFRGLNYSSSFADRNSTLKNSGFSVRCLRD